MKIVRRGALPVGGESGLLDVRDRAVALGTGARRTRGDRCEPRTSGRRSSSACSRSSTSTAIRPLRVVIDAANGMAGAMLPPVLERLPSRGRPLLLRAGRLVPEPRAEPAAAREPRVHRRARRARRAPTSASPTTATPTAASSSTTPASSSPATSSRRSSPRAMLAQGAGREGDLRRARVLGRARDDRARRRRPARQPRRARVHQAADARGGRRLRRRGVGALLLPRLLPGRLGRRSRSCSCSSSSRSAAGSCPSSSRRCARATSSPARSTRRSPTWR